MSLMNAVAMALNKWREETESQLEDGDSFVTIFNDCILYINFEDGNLKTNFILDKPLEINESIFNLLD